MWIREPSAVAQVPVPSTVGREGPQPSLLQHSLLLSGVDCGIVAPSKHCAVLVERGFSKSPEWETLLCTLVGHFLPREGAPHGKDRRTGLGSTGVLTGGVTEEQK